MRLLIVFLLLFVTAAQPARSADFSGTWEIDLRSPSERARKVECGAAYFELAQSGDQITGSHSFAAVGCGRLNEGGPETVKGVVVNGVAVLAVTSGRNGAVVLGTAKLSGNKLHWQKVHEVRAGEPATDSPLILERGALSRAKQPSQ